MVTRKKILVLCEDGIIRKESIQYSVELARRMDLPIAFLMLVSAESNIFGLNDEIDEELIMPIEHAGIKISREIRYGDKATEFLKYLAANSNPAAIVWGSDKTMVGKLGTGKPHHWLNRLSGLLPCSIVSPIPKNRQGNKKLSEG